MCPQPEHPATDDQSVRAAFRPRLCPRCGYDQQGVMDSWTEACPVRSPCSECGYDIEWSKVLGPQADVLPWFVEHVPRRRFARACVQTFVRLFRPARFWSEVQPHHPVRVFRAMLWIASLLLVMQMLSGLFIGLDLFRQASGRRAESGLLVLDSLHHAGFQDNLASCIVYGVFFPVVEFEVDSVARFVVGQDSPSFRLNTFSMWGGFFPLAVLATLLVPLSLKLTSTTLQRARVRGHHLGRATLYSLAWLAFAALIWLLCAVSMLLDPGSARDGELLDQCIEFVSEDQRYGPAAVAVWLFVFWHHALTRGWHVRQPWWHTLPLIVLACLGALAFGYGCQLWLASERAIQF